MGATDRQSIESCIPKEVWLIRFGDKDWRDHLKQWAQDYKFHATLPAKLDRAEADWHATQPQPPESVITHHAVDDMLQTGDSRLLGGGMEIKASWRSPETGD